MNIEPVWVMLLALIVIAGFAFVMIKIDESREKTAH